MSYIESWIQVLSVTSYLADTPYGWHFWRG